MSTAFTSLKGHFLISMPALQDPMFANSVTYLCEHTADGAMGLIINHPLELTLHEVFEHLQIAENRTHEVPVLAGGPVQTERGFVLHTATEESWEHSLKLTDQLCLTTSQDILAAIARDEGPEQSLVTLGYAGWSAGQLEEELAENAWLTIPADLTTLFETPYAERPVSAAARHGIDLTKLSSQAGHA